MSKKPAGSKRKLDRRVQRTYTSLYDAIVELMHEKPFDEITVQDVLGRAGVSRSTFYAHFRDKDDLFLSDVDHFFEAAATMLSRRGEDSNRVAPVRELFEHIAKQSAFYAALVASGKIHEVLELAQGHFARGIGQRLAERSPASPKDSPSRAAMANALAGALLSLMTWWIDRGTRGTPEEMDEIYHRMVWSGVTPPSN